MTVATRVHTAVLLDHLHLAHDIEQKLAGLLTRQVAGLPDGEYRTWLQDHAVRARERTHDLDVRLVVLGETRRALSATVGAVWRLADDALDVSTAAITAGVDVVRRQPIEPAVLDHARVGAAAVAEARAVYRAIVEVARVAEDPQTTALATSCHSELSTLLAELDDAVPALVAAALDAAQSRPTYREAADTATRRVRAVAAVLGEDAGAAQHELRDTLDRILRRARPASAADEDPAEITAPPELGEDTEGLPIADYDQLTAAQIIDQLPDLTPDQLAVLHRYEHAHADRVTVGNKIRSLLEDAPTPHTTP
ncbi:hypothetical protein [Actinokineospora sp.]|uniref:hypothetical protein n=1 Tax=Actinokineospora sp. TaxID=1872133 RepID=UPI003D6B48DA